MAGRGGGLKTPRLQASSRDASREADQRLDDVPIPPRRRQELRRSGLANTGSATRESIERLIAAGKCTKSVGDVSYIGHGLRALRRKSSAISGRRAAHRNCERKIVTAGVVIPNQVDSTPGVQDRIGVREVRRIPQVDDDGAVVGQIYNQP